MAQQAGVRAVFLAEALGKVRAWNIDLMRARLKKQRVDDARHMARDTAARFGAGGMACMRGDPIPELAVAAETHLVGANPSFQRRQVVLGVGFVWRVAGGALSRALPITSRTSEGFDNERRLAETAIFKEGPPGKCVIRPAPGTRYVIASRG